MIIGKTWWSDGHNAQTARKQRVINGNTQLAFFLLVKFGSWSGSSQHSQPNLQNPSQTYPKISLQGDSRSYEADDKNKPLKNE